MDYMCDLYVVLSRNSCTLHIKSSPGKSNICEQYLDGFDYSKCNSTCGNGFEYETDNVESLIHVVSLHG